VTKIKIKLHIGFIYIIGVTTNSDSIKNEYIGKTPGSYGFGCEDGHLYTNTNSPLVDRKCNPG
jgi:hypothetical protein